MSVSESLRNSLACCNHCPRECGVNRLTGELGYCKTGITPLVASVCLHKGEEPVISGDKGICNVFFAHCNLHCVYCQNHQISRNDVTKKEWLDNTDDIINSITCILDKGIKRLGFVSPTHQLLQMVEIITKLNEMGYHPVVVYNSNAYDNPLILREIQILVNVYLPDIKYYSIDLSLKYSDVNEYFTKAQKSLKEMVWQKGTSLQLDDDGCATEGVIVRHLILPGHVDDTLQILETIANSISTNLNISLMSQYYPNEQSKPEFPELGRTLSKFEYQKAVKAMKEFGFHRGFTQNLESSSYYKPHFQKSNPFED